jgi:hypothetical protein
MVPAGVAFVVGREATLWCPPSEAATARVYPTRGKRKSRLEGDDNGERALSVAVSKPAIGIQCHHSVFLDDALRSAANSRAGLRSAIQRTGDPDRIAVAERADDVRRELRTPAESHLAAPRRRVTR